MVHNLPLPQPSYHSSIQCTHTSPLSLTLRCFFTRHTPHTLGLARAGLSAQSCLHSDIHIACPPPLTILFRMSALSPFLQPWKDKGIWIYHPMFISSTHLKSSNILPNLLISCVYFLFQFSSVAQSCPTPWDPMDYSTPGDPMDCSTPGFPIHH